MDVDTVWRHIDEQRESLADLVEPLAPEQWTTPSLCDAWQVGDVAAHLTLAQMGLCAVVVEAIRARGSFNRMIRDTALRAAGQEPVVYAGRLRAMVGSRRKAPGVSPLEPLTDVLVHGQDIAVPLGIDRPVPAAAAAASAQRCYDMGFPFGARRRLRGLRLVATDTDWSVGEGRVVEGPVRALLLLVTGRTPAALPALSGATDRLLVDGASGPA
jgi:uncharacterized protein (TIGR03083 family)